MSIIPVEKGKGIFTSKKENKGEYKASPHAAAHTQ